MTKKTRKSYGFGIVGCGVISEFQARAIQAMKGGHLACVFSRSTKNANRVGKEFGVSWYTDYKKFLAHEGLYYTLVDPRILRRSAAGDWRYFGCLSKL